MYKLILQYGTLDTFYTIFLAAGLYFLENDKLVEGLISLALGLMFVFIRAFLRHKTEKPLAVSQSSNGANLTLSQSRRINR